jgi:hypothetical protein
MISAAPANKASALVADPASISGVVTCASANTAVAVIISAIPMILRIFVPRFASGSCTIYRPS